MNIENTITDQNFLIHQGEAFPNPLAQNIATVKDGNWDDPSVWSNGIPSTNSSVVISHNITINNTSAIAKNLVVECGMLIFNPIVNTKLSVGTLILICCGGIQIGTADQPVIGITEIVIRDIPIDISFDPGQYLTGFLAVDDTIVSIHGAPKTTAATQLRLAVEPIAGAQELIMENAPVGWQIGDIVILPPTEAIQYAEWVQPGYLITEEFTIASIKANKIILDHPVQHNHKAAYDIQGNVTFLPHLINISRNVKIRSENPSGTRGHILFSHMVNVDINYAEFKDLGRTTGLPLNTTTNVKGRYSLHIHHLMGPENPTDTGYQFRLIGNAITHGRKWGIAIHQSSYGYIKDNNIYDFNTAGIATEEGNEYLNLIDNNIVAKIIEPSTIFNTTADGFWFAQPSFNIITNNVSTCSYGSDYFGVGYHIDPTRSNRGTNEPRPYPLFRGADLMASGQFKLVPHNTTTFTIFNNNEAYATNRGISLDHYGLTNNPIMLMSNLKFWGCWSTAIDSYGGQQECIYDYITVRKSGWGCLTQNSQDATQIYRHLDLQSNEQPFGVQAYGFVYMGGIGNKTKIVIEDAYINCRRGIIIYFASSAGVSQTSEIANMQRDVVINNVKLDNPPGVAKHYIELSAHYNNVDSVVPMSKHQVLAHNLQNIPGNCTQIYWKEQAPNAPAPYLGDYACPASGLTNQESWEQFGLAFGGEVARSTTEVEGIIGFVSNSTVYISPAN